LKKRIYLVDFDGTISKKDSFCLFTFFSVNIFSFLKYWAILFFFFPFYTNPILKEKFFLNFKGYNEDKFNSLCIEFIKFKFDKIIKKSFLNYINSIEGNPKIVVVSASINNYLKPWCDKMGFELISTELETVDGKLTGKFSTPNCNGFEKVIRINKKYNLSNYEEIHVFGNSKGDLPMLKLGTHKYYKFFIR